MFVPCSTRRRLEPCRQAESAQTQQRRSDHPQRRNRRRGRSATIVERSPKRPSGPRITSKPNRPRKPVERQQDLHRRGAGARHRHRTVLRARAVRHRCHVVQPARLPKRDLDAAGHQGRPLAGVRGAHRRSRLHLRHAGDMGASRRCGRLHHPRERRHHRNRQERELQERSTHRPWSSP